MLLESRRHGALAREEHLVTHAAGAVTQEEGRRRQRSRAAQHAAERLGELAVGDRLGSGEVDHAFEFLVVEGPLERGEQVVEGDPRPVLVAVTQPGAEPGLERREHGGRGRRPPRS